MPAEAVVVPDVAHRDADQGPIDAIGLAYSIHEWAGSGPTYLHVHYADDETWHVLAGTLRFRLADREVEAPAGTTVFVPAGVAHSYMADASGRYLIILTPRLRDLIGELHGAPMSEHAAIMRRYRSEILE